MLLVCYLLLVVLSYSLWLEVPVRGLVVCVNQSDWEIPAQEHAGMTKVLASRDTYFIPSSRPFLYCHPGPRAGISPNPLTTPKQLPPNRNPLTTMNNSKPTTNNKHATKTGTAFAHQEANNKNPVPW